MSAQFSGEDGDGLPVVKAEAEEIEHLGYDGAMEGLKGEGGGEAVILRILGGDERRKLERREGGKKLRGREEREREKMDETHADTRRVDLVGGEQGRTVADLEVEGGGSGCQLTDDLDAELAGSFFLGEGR